MIFQHRVTCRKTPHFYVLLISLAGWLGACGETGFKGEKTKEMQRQAVGAVVADDNSSADINAALACDLEASSTSVKKGKKVKIAYRVAGRATEVTLNSAPLAELTQGSISVVIDVAKTFVMEVANAKDTASCSVRVYLDEQVDETPPPPPDLPKADALCSLLVSPATAVAGSPVTLTFTVDGVASAASINGIAIDPRGGSLQLQPEESTIYTATVISDTGNSSCSGAFTVAGESKPIPPPSCRLEASAASVNAGQALQLKLLTYGDVTSALLDGSSATNGTSKSVTPQASRAYSASVTGPGGSADCSANVTVVDVPAPPAPTCALIATPAAITAGAGTKLRMTWAGAVTVATLDQYVLAKNDTSLTVTPSATRVYTGTVAGPGGKNTCRATVTVNAQPPPPAPTCSLSPASQTITAGDLATVALTWSGDVHTALIAGVPVTSNGGRVALQADVSQTIVATVSGPGGQQQCTAQVVVNPLPPATYLLRVNKSGLGQGVVVTGSGAASGINCGSDCSESYQAGTHVTLTANPAATATFIGWSGCVAKGNTCDVVLDQNLQVTANFGVGEPTLESVTISGGASVEKTQSLQLEAQAHYSDGSTRVVTNAAGIAWSSANTAVATVGAGSGLVTGVNVGPADIRVNFGGAGATKVINVAAARVVSVAITGPATVQKGETISLIAIATYADNSTQNITDLNEIAWSSSSSVAAIIGSGLVKGMSTGSATIRANFGGQSATKAVEVINDLSVINVTGTVDIRKGQLTSLNATAIFLDGTSYDITTASNAIWNSQRPDIATVGLHSGVVTALAVGQSMVSITYMGKVSQVNIIVREPEITNITITGDSAVEKGKTLQLAALATYSDNSTRDITSAAGVSWTAAAPTVAAVNGSGLVTGLSAGSTTIYVNYADRIVAKNITVTPAEVTSVAITGSDRVEKGRTLQLTAIATYSDNSTRDVSNAAGVSWAPGIPALAAVNGGGLVTGLAPGVVKIYVAYANKGATKDITVTPPSLTSLVISGGSSVQKSKQLQLVATAVYSDQSTQEITTAASWSSAAPQTAMVGVSTGVVTGIGMGNTQILVAFGGMTAQKTVTVEEVACTPSGSNQIIDFEAQGALFESQGNAYKAVTNNYPGLVFSLESQVTGQPLSETPILTKVLVGSETLPGNMTQAWRDSGADNHASTSDFGVASGLMGRWVLTMQDAYSRVRWSPLPKLVVDYAAPVAAASGYLVDVDHKEAWNVSGYNSAGTVVATWNFTAADNAGSGRVKYWNLSSATANIVKIKITGWNTRSGRDVLGFAFDKFSPSAPICNPQ